MLAERQAASQREAQGLEVLNAVRDTYTWVTEHTKTFNEHWVEECRTSPYEPFPRYDYLAILFEILDAGRIVWIEKSRDMMVSWACVAYLTLKAMTTPECGVLFQTQKENKAIQLVKYAKCLYDQQPDFLREAFPLTKPTRDQPALSLEFKHGGYISGIPGGADQIRSYHPYGYLNDESSFQPEGRVLQRSPGCRKRQDHLQQLGGTFMVCGCPPRHHSKWRRLRQRRFSKAYRRWRRRRQWTSCRG